MSPSLGVDAKAHAADTVDGAQHRPVVLQLHHAFSTWDQYFWDLPAWDGTDSSWSAAQWQHFKSLLQSDQIDH